MKPRQLTDALARLTDEKLLALSPLTPRQKTGLELYCPHQPFPKQQAFLDLTCREALYGGGAGPGKTDALLMAALQYVHVPGYSALILRRDYPRLSLPNSIMDRARQWLHRSNAVWNSQTKAYRFPSGAVLQFGYVDSPDDRYRYASSEYQFIGWDELTEFRLGLGDDNPYEFMFSRLRRPADMPVPLRMRAASNPGNIGHQYVKQRFVTERALAALRDDRPQVFYADPQTRDRAFVPALLADNPFLDREAYMANLMHLPSVTRARLLQGDWSVTEDAIIRADWLRYYDQNGGTLCPLNELREPLGVIVDARNCRRLATVDTAGTSKQKAEERKGKAPSWSVCQIWDYWPKHEFLFLRYVWRDRVNWDGLKAGVRQTLRTWRPQTTLVENAHHGPPLQQELQREFHAQLINPVSHRIRGQGGVPGKVERATLLLTKLEQGEVFLPVANNSWLLELEQEFLSWTGLNDEPADQIDAAAYAASHARLVGKGEPCHPIRMSRPRTGIPGLWSPGRIQW
jgi:phage terminase large subunit-like protein